MKGLQLSYWFLKPCVVKLHKLTFKLNKKKVHSSTSRGVWKLEESLQMALSLRHVPRQSSSGSLAEQLDHRLDQSGLLEAVG